MSSLPKSRAAAPTQRGSKPTAKGDRKKTGSLERYRAKRDFGNMAALPDSVVSKAKPAARGRHPSLEGLRSDKPAKPITRGLPVAPPAAKHASKPSVGTVGTTKVTHPQRVIDSSSGITKLELVRYYESVADWMVPHLKGRACAMLRGPSGIEGQLFFQKHLGRVRIAQVKELDRALWPEHEPLLEVPNAAALVAAAQMNVIEFHTWNSLVKNFDKPDRIVFDLDPGEGVTWKQMQEGTALTRSLLQQLGLQGWLKTSGGKGLHIVVPIMARLDWPAVRAFAQALVEQLARVIPDRFVAKSGPANRIGKIFVDYLRNTHGATTVAAYSARARPGLGVSMPIDWGQLSELKSGAQWTIKDAPGYLSLRREDPWKDHWTSRQSISKAMKTLGVSAAAS